ncbi:CatB-related O-acetyltransferase [Candidatus Pelagibacter sp.]|nr:CatB-related O-acetyltransferase [Candidatus Pelagibacter sp.]MDC1030709.1 CatB-related O-acetyltransferase [Candidatus Pelagibacter sp.]
MINNFFKKFKKKKVYKNYFLKDNLKKEINLKLAIVGKWSYGNPRILRWDYSSKIKIGNFCSLGPDIDFYIGGNHRVDWISTSQLPASQFNDVFEKAKTIKNFSISKGDIEIGHDVWIGGRTTILSGVKIGTGAVIAAGSVVVNDVDPYTIAGGNPNRIIKKRFKDSTIQKLLETEWWNLSDDKIDILSPYLLSNNFDAFFESIKNIENQNI